MRSLSLFLSILGVALLGASAVAEPVTRPGACELTITRAPDAVRAAIEAWVKAEPQCSTSLELRVVPTDGGFYLIGRDGSGRLRERVVPDAQSAGVLVASWMADDVPVAGTPVGPAPAPPPVVEPAPAPPVEAAPPPVEGVAAPIRPPGEAAPAPAPYPQEDGLSRRWIRGPRAFAVGALFGAKGGGVRGELDLRVRGKWSIGLALSLSNTQQKDDLNELQYIDARAVAMLGRSETRGKWTFRVHGGLGVTRTEVRLGDTTGAGVFGTAEAGVTVSRELRRGWSVVGGPLVTWYLQDVVSDQMETRRNSEVLMFGGLRHRR